MSKRVKSLLIALALLLIAGAAVAVVLLMPQEGGDGDETVTTTATAAADIVIVDKQQNADGKTVEAPVTQIRVTNALDTYTVITRDDNTMAVEAYADLLSDSTAIDTMCESLAYLTALAKPAANEADEAYGFDAPTATVTVIYHDGSEETIVFGAESKGTAGYYCRKDGDSTLYIVDSAVVTPFLTDGKQLIGKTLIVAPSPAEDDDEGVSQLLTLWLTGSCRDRAIEIITDTDTNYPGLTYVSTYVITSPYVRSVDSDRFHTMATTMRTLVADSVEKAHPTAEDLETYGLADPYSVAAFTLSVVSTASADGGGTVSTHYNDREHMVMLGNKNEDGNYYALVDGYDIVYVLTPSSVPWAELEYYDVTNKLLFMKDITTVDDVTVTENGTATVFELAHHPDKEKRDEQMTVTSGGKTYSTPEFRILYQLMIGIHRVGEKESNATVSGEPVLVLEMSFNDGSDPMSISLYPMTASRYLCVTDDGEQTAVSISDTEEFLRQYQNYLTGQPVTSPY